MFHHPGGHIRNEDGSLHNFLEPDPPGWYFWFTDRSGYTDLKGPYTSEQDAEFYQEQLSEYEGSE